VKIKTFLDKNASKAFPQKKSKAFPKPTVEPIQTATCLDMRKLVGGKIQELKERMFLTRMYELEPELVGACYESMIENLGSDATLSEKFKSASSTVFPYKVPDGTADIRLLDPSAVVPANRNQAMKSIYWPHYLAAEKLEIATLQALGAWELVEREDVTAGAKVLKGRMVYAHKKKEGKIIFVKARYVAQGCFQTEGVDYDATYSSVMTLKSWRMLLSLANSDPSFELGHADIKAAYLMATREIPAFCEQPQGHEVGVMIGNRRARMILKLIRSLYGLKDSGHLWQKTFAEHMAKIGLKPLPSDPACYMLRVKDSWILLGTFVDDLFVVCNDPKLRAKVLAHMASIWEVKYDPELQWALNTSIKRDKKGGVLKISQEAYVRETLTKFGADHATPAATPGVEGDSLKNPNEVTDEEVAEVAEYRFRELIGALLWIAMVSRPDICVAVNLAARAQHRPNKQLWTFLTRILRYLKKFPDYGLVYRRQTLPKGCSPLSIFVDVSFAPSVDENRGKSVIGYLVKYLGNTVAWTTTKSRRTLLSSTEAECNGLAEATKENVWQRCLQRDVNLFKVTAPTPVYEDNSGTRALCTAKTYHKRSKHFGLEWYYVKERVADGELVVVAVGTDDQEADSLTKLLGSYKTERFRDAIMGSALDQRYFEDLEGKSGAVQRQLCCRYHPDRQYVPRQ
jgi:hypothetical protein